jgi:Phosphatidylglycerophosphate synthase
MTGVAPRPGGSHCPGGGRARGLVDRLSSGRVLTRWGLDGQDDAETPSTDAETPLGRRGVGWKDRDMTLRSRPAALRERAGCAGPAAAPTPRHSALRQVPNLLSLSRAVLAPVVPCVVRRAPRTARTLLVVAGLTDVLDGSVARRWDLTSEAGARLDSYADVVLFLSMGAAVLRAVPPRERTWLVIAAVPIGAVRICSLVAGRSVVPAEARHSTVNRLAGAAVSLGTGLVLVGARPVVLVPGAALASLGAIGEITALRDATRQVSEEEIAPSRVLPRFLNAQRRPAGGPTGPARTPRRR